MPNPSVPLGPFMRQVKARLAELSREELCSFLVERARHTAAPEREAFFSLLQKVPGPPPDAQERLDSFLSKLKSGAYYGDGDWTPDAPTAAMAWPATMDALFANAATAFAARQYELAAHLYGGLLHAFQLEGEGSIFCGSGSAQSMVGTDLDDAKARYLRALYESTPEERRGELLLREFISLSNIGSWRISLQDVSAAEDAPLSESESFYAQFEAQLRANSRDGQTRLYPKEDLRRALLREVVSLQRGTSGLLELAKEEGALHPEIYQELLGRLSPSTERETLLTVARDGMLHIEDNNERTLFSDKVASLAASLGEEALSRAAQLQAFRATPTQPRLLQLLAFISQEDMRAWATRELEEARHRVDLPESVATWLSLLCGDTRSALHYLKNASPLGWSRPAHPGRVAFPALLLFAAKSTPSQGSSLNELLQETNASEDGGTSSAGSGHILAAVLTKESTAEERRAVLDVVVGLAQTRIRAIISEQYKRAFSKAALLSVACAEACYLAGLTEKGDKLLGAQLEEFRRQPKYREEAERRRASSPILSRSESRSI